MSDFLQSLSLSLLSPVSAISDLTLSERKEKSSKKSVHVIHHKLYVEKKAEYAVTRTYLLKNEVRITTALVR